MLASDRRSACELLLTRVRSLDAKAEQSRRYGPAQRRADQLAELDAFATRMQQEASCTVTRFEVIDHREILGDLRGRTLVANPCTVELSYQDDGRTLKVFVTDASQVGAGVTREGRQEETEP